MPDHQTSRPTGAVVVAVVAVVLAVVATGFAVVISTELAPAALSHGLASPAAGSSVPPIADEPASRIAVAGDTGTGTAPVGATVERMRRESRQDPYDALLLLGDLIYEDGEAAQTEARVISPFAPILDTGATLLPVLGNHDYRSNQQQQILEKLGQHTPWYVEQIGPAKVIVLDSNQADNAQQRDWLRTTLAEPVTSGTWVIVAMHHPAYSAGNHGSDMAVRNAWSPLFAEFNVPLVLAGHDHDYQRSTPQNGVTYIVSGAAARLRPTGQENFTAVSASTLHYLDLLVYDDKLLGRAIDHSGVLVDTFAITR
ncbi:metallophosphoesterase family protein [Marisediminicola antarctica]